MNDILLSVDGLATHLGSALRPVRAVDGVSFTIRQGETFALLGESGCGKSMTALSLMRLLPASGRIVGGSVEFEDRDLLRCSEAEMREVRGAGMSMIFQEPMTSLNPVMTVGQQIVESLSVHRGMKGHTARAEAIRLLDAVGIPGPARRIDEYPHQLSGGMKQRVMIAIALAGEPKLLIADEPTTALDVTIQAQVLDLMRQLQRERAMAIMLITHDLGVVAEVADHVAVMYAGEIVELAERESFFRSPEHPYSLKLFDSLPTQEKRNRTLSVIKGTVPSLRSEFQGCRYAPRCDYVMPVCRERRPEWAVDENRRVLCHLYHAGEPPTVRATAAGAPAPPVSVPRTVAREPLLAVSGLKVLFPIQAGVFKRTVGWVRAVDGVDLSIPQGRTLALVGESGCGKTTVGKGILQLVRPTAGSVRFRDHELTALPRASLREYRTDLQIIFQDPYSSMNPRMMVGDIVAEGMKALRVGAGPQQRSTRVDELLAQVGLPADSAGLYPHEFSGGQRQRICVARALAVEPKLIVCDEPTSALDVSVQAQILNLLKRLQDDLHISFLFITHNISVVSYLAHEVAVMYLGRIVERGGVNDVLNRPRHPYTMALLSAVPSIDPETKREVIRLKGDMPSPSQPPSGCHFHPRCPQAMDICREKYPDAVESADGGMVACHLHTQVG